MIMAVICGIIIIGIWFEHLLLLGPALSHGSTSISLGLADLLITLGFLGLMVLAIRYFLQTFPELYGVEGTKQ